MIVLIGETDPAYIGRSQEKYAEFIDDIEPTMAII